LAPRVLENLLFDNLDTPIDSHFYVSRRFPRLLKFIEFVQL